MYISVTTQISPAVSKIASIAQLQMKRNLNPSFRYDLKRPVTEPFFNKYYHRCTLVTSPYKTTDLA